MARMPRCRIIARYGIGVDTIDLAAATDAGIIVTNNPTYCIEEVAEHTMALLLAAARKIAFYERLVRGGRWELPPGKPLYRLVGQTLGLVGFGNIARAVAVRAHAFGLRIVYCDPFVWQGQFDVPGDKRELPELLAEADFVSLHPPLNSDTRGMMNDAAFAKMKPSAILINCSRGPVVDTAALARALDAGRIAGLRARHHGSRAPPRPPPAPRPRERDRHPPRRLVQRAGHGRPPGRSPQRSPPRPHRPVAGERGEPRGERTGARRTLKTILVRRHSATRSIHAVNDNHSRPRGRYAGRPLGEGVR
jgi:D-3-phosphoglycerate dehydrogenase